MRVSGVLHSCFRVQIHAELEHLINTESWWKHTSQHGKGTRFTKASWCNKDRNENSSVSKQWINLCNKKELRNMEYWLEWFQTCLQSKPTFTTQFCHCSWGQLEKNGKGNNFLSQIHVTWSNLSKQVANALRIPQNVLYFSKRSDVNRNLKELNTNNKMHEKISQTKQAIHHKSNSRQKLTHPFSFNYRSDTITFRYIQIWVTSPCSHRMSRFRMQICIKYSDDDSYFEDTDLCILSSANTFDAWLQVGLKRQKERWSKSGRQWS